MSSARWTLALVAVLGLALAPVAGAGTTTPHGSEGTATPLAVDLSGHDDRTTTVSPAALRAEPAVDVGPGTLLVITIPDAGAFACSANFVWEAGDTRYLGAAGHCFLPPDAATTHGKGQRYDPTDVTVRACVRDCSFGGLTGQVLEGELVELGSVAYARQTEGGSDIGSDFGLVQLPPEVPVRTAMPAFGGPSGAARLQPGDLVCHYGNGVVFGEAWPTMGRTGLGLTSVTDVFTFAGAASPGDSGAAVQTCVAGADGLRGTAAVGVLTHLTSAGVAGTTLERARHLVARDAGFGVTVVLNGP